MAASKVCAVFGYGPGLGAAMARKWSNEGFQVAIMSRTLDKVKVGSIHRIALHGMLCHVMAWHCVHDDDDNNANDKHNGRSYWHDCFFVS